MLKIGSIVWGVRNVPSGATRKAPTTSFWKIQTGTASASSRSDYSKRQTTSAASLLTLPPSKPR
jgi:hypothetical protein